MGRRPPRATAGRTLIRASVPERVAMRLTGHTSRAIFDRDNIINESISRCFYGTHGPIGTWKMTPR